MKEDETWCHLKKQKSAQHVTKNFGDYGGDRNIVVLLAVRKQKDATENK
jgi:hypothetical protein